MAKDDQKRTKKSKKDKKGDKTHEPTASTPPPEKLKFAHPIAKTISPHIVRTVPELHPTVKFQPLPKPTGPTPYHLSLEQVIPDKVPAIKEAGRLVFHIAGDTGGVKVPQDQRIVAMHMVTDYEGTDTATQPAFFYHLGDVVYYNGEDSKYYDQFYEPYSDYPLPIFAIPGNHDGDPIDNTTPSLDAFVANLCSPTPVVRKEAGEYPRH